MNDKKLLRELIYRLGWALPIAEQDEKWIYEGFDNEGDRRILLTKCYETLGLMEFEEKDTKKE